MWPSFHVGTRDNIHDNLLSSLLHFTKVNICDYNNKCKLLAAASSRARCSFLCLSARSDVACCTLNLKVAVGHPLFLRQLIIVISFVK